MDGYIFGKILSPHPRFSVHMCTVHAWKLMFYHAVHFYIFTPHWEGEIYMKTNEHMSMFPINSETNTKNLVRAKNTNRKKEMIKRQGHSDNILQLSHNKWRFLFLPLYLLPNKQLHRFTSVGSHLTCNYHSKVEQLLK